MNVTPLLSSPLHGARGELARTARRVWNALRFAGGLDRPRTGCTPYRVVWSRDKATLRHFTTGPAAGPPVLLVPSLINRSHIWDLRQGDSFVEGLHAEGYDVFLVDWGRPDQRDATNSMATYVDDYLPAAVEAVREETGAIPIMMGHCFGGVVAALWAASAAEQPPAMVCLGVPTNWLEMGPLAAMTAQGRLDPEHLVDDTGNVPPGTMLSAFQILRPLGDITGYVTLWTRMHDRRAVQAFWTLIDWSHDHVPFPGAAFVEMVRLLSRENGLATGHVVLGNRVRRLADISCPFLSVYGAYDHVTPPASVLPLVEVVGAADRQAAAVQAGHVGLLVGSSARTRTLPLISDWLRERGLGGNLAKDRHA